MNKRIFLRIAQWFSIGVAVLLCFINYSERMLQIRALPDTLHVTGETGRFPQLLTPEAPAAAAVDVQHAERLSDVGEELYTFRLFGVVPIRSVRVVHTERQYLVPGGVAVGITLHTRGVLVVGMGSVRTSDGMLSPGSAAGLQPGDLILAVGGQEIENTAHLAAICAAQDGVVTLEVERSGALITVRIYPALDVESGEYRLGLWVRDSTAGVGTLSFYDENSGWFGALGHAVSDVDTQSTLSVRDGKLVAAEVMDVMRGMPGEPGELLGAFSGTGPQIGSILLNTDYGIYGTMAQSYRGAQAGAVPMAYAYEAHEGPATILSTVSGSSVQPFSCNIIRVSTQQTPGTKGMIVQVNDAELIERTGGIVQGMSGSPILQDGKLIGVVTHVFVNDPTKGYCIYAEWMYQQILEQVS